MKSQYHFRKFDNDADSYTMDQAANGYRDSYNSLDCPEWERPRLKEKAAWCQSLADRKRREGK